jgi:hypothetical protein
MITTGQPLGAVSYALIGFTGLVAAAIVGVYLVNNLDILTSRGVGAQAYYVLLIVLGIAVAIFLFGVLRSTATLTGSQFGYAIDLGGPAVIAVLVVFGGFYLTKATSDEFALTLFLHGGQPASEIAKDAVIVVDLEGRRDRVSVSAAGELTIKGIPTRLRNAKVPISLESNSFRIKDLQKAYRIPANGVIYIEVVPISEAEKKRQQLGRQIENSPRVDIDSFISVLRDRAETFTSDLDQVIVVLDKSNKIEPADAKAAKDDLKRLRGEFVAFQKKHMDAVTAGNVLLAHELVGKIHNVQSEVVGVVRSRVGTIGRGWYASLGRAYFDTPDPEQDPEYHAIARDVGNLTDATEVRVQSLRYPGDAPPSAPPEISGLAFGE